MIEEKLEGKGAAPKHDGLKSLSLSGAREKEFVDATSIKAYFKSLLNAANNGRIIFYNNNAREKFIQGLVKFFGLKTISFDVSENKIIYHDNEESDSYRVALYLPEELNAIKMLLSNEELKAEDTGVFKKCLKGDTTIYVGENADAEIQKLFQQYEVYRDGERKLIVLRHGGASVFNLKTKKFKDSNTWQVGIGSSGDSNSLSIYPLPLSLLKQADDLSIDNYIETLDTHVSNEDKQEAKINLSEDKRKIAKTIAKDILAELNRLELMLENIETQPFQTVQRESVRKSLIIQSIEALFEKVKQQGYSDDIIKLASELVFLDERKTLLNAWHGRHMLPVYENEEDEEKFYRQYCNERLWTLFHRYGKEGRTETFEYERPYDADLFQLYREVNEAFANAIANNVADDDLVWVHDYHFILVPGILRSKKPDAKIGFFLHIPFPALQVVKKEMKDDGPELIESLLQADQIGFHTENYRQNFIDAAQWLYGGQISMQKRNGAVILQYQGKEIKLDVYPIGVDQSQLSISQQALEAARAEEKFNAQVEQACNHCDEVSKDPNHRIIFAVDRVDPPKGWRIRLKAIENFLDNHPDKASELTFMFVRTQSRKGIKEYDQLFSDVKEEIRRLNQKYADNRSGNGVSAPLIIEIDSGNQKELAMLRKKANIFWAAALIDGLQVGFIEYLLGNREFLDDPDNAKPIMGILSTGENSGVGLAEQLGDNDQLALTYDPINIEAFEQQLLAVLKMPIDEQHQRMLNCLDIIEDVFHAKKWILRCLCSMYGFSSEQIKFLANQFGLIQYPSESSIKDKRIINRLLNSCRMVNLDFSESQLRFVENTLVKNLNILAAETAQFVQSELRDPDLFLHLLVNEPEKVLSRIASYVNLPEKMVAATPVKDIISNILSKSPPKRNGEFFKRSASVPLPLNVGAGNNSNFFQPPSSNSSSNSCTSICEEPYNQEIKFSEEDIKTLENSQTPGSASPGKKTFSNNQVSNNQDGTSQTPNYGPDETPSNQPLGLKL